MRHASGICASIAKPHRRDIDVRSQIDTPERGITFGCSPMLTTCGDARDTPDQLMLDRCSIACPAFDGSTARPILAPSLTSQDMLECDACMPDAYARRRCYVRRCTDGRTNGEPCSSNALRLRPYRARVYAARFASRWNHGWFSSLIRVIHRAVRAS